MLCRSGLWIAPVARTRTVPGQTVTARGRQFRFVVLQTTLDSPAAGFRALAELLDVGATGFGLFLRAFPVLCHLLLAGRTEFRAVLIDALPDLSVAAFGIATQLLDFGTTRLTGRGARSGLFIGSRQ